MTYAKKPEATATEAARLALEVAERSAADALTRLEQARLRMDVVSTLPDEPKRGSVIKFYVQYNNGSQVYTYVALRTDVGAWFVTGRSDPMTWDELIRLMMRDISTKMLGVGFYLFGNSSKKAGEWIGRRPE